MNILLSDISKICLYWDRYNQDLKLAEQQF